MSDHPENYTEQTYLPPALRPKLAKLGVVHLSDLLLYLPLRYEDQTRAMALADLRVGESVVVDGVVERSEIRYQPRRQLIVALTSADNTKVAYLAPSLLLRYFNFYPNLQKTLSVGNKVRVFGEVREGRYGLEMVHPIIKPESDEESPKAARLTPIYPSGQGVPQATLRSLVAKALRVPQWQVDYLPDSIRQRYALLSWRVAVATLHAPNNEESLVLLENREHTAWRRIKFDELLAQQLALREAKQLRASEKAPTIQPTQQLSTLLRQSLAFRLTDAQERTLAEILADLQATIPMTRLLQGDVGSGKTIVAVLAALAAIEAGYQVAFMAPTELLAEQHYRKLQHWLVDFPVRLSWLAGSMTAAELRESQTLVKRGEAHIAIGTHALFQKKVTFPRLGLVVIDEQHRFGVDQRLLLRQRGQQDGECSFAPHQLMMSATPIPRSLAMSYYADLDVSVIDEMPGGRQPVVTRLATEARRTEIAGRIYQAVRQGAQAYWVCPLIEESDKMEIELQNATALHVELSAQMPDTRVALLHGRLKTEEKTAIMADFVANRIQVLVATTVIEVGVDVPNASWMVIEHAERFGLAQLHQLRGRVGRGAAASNCILLFAAKLSITAKQRLKVIYENTDGFTIAREDLRIRGPGELLGSRQSGLPSLRYANIEDDLDLVEAARDAAVQLADDPTFDKTAFLERWIKNRTDYVSV